MACKKIMIEEGTRSGGSGIVHQKTCESLASVSEDKTNEEGNESSEEGDEASGTSPSATCSKEEDVDEKSCAEEGNTSKEEENNEGEETSY